CEDLFRQLVRDFLLKQALERACTERRIVTSIGEPVSSLVREMQMEVVGILGNTLDSCELDVHNSANLLLAERPEHDDLVDAVQELRTQALLEQPEDLLSDVLQRRRIDVTVGDLEVLLDELGAHVARHDNDGVAEVGYPPLVVGQAAVVKDLQEDVEDLRMGLLD